ncbi:3'(2'),5'-bisphosphate nucleotidase-like protein [Elsinoe fawcettii]|nr:3'(2'),5'-bisphosphate nucleotidase-like protein [Elsinoe fawcettii]
MLFNKPLKHQLLLLSLVILASSFLPSLLPRLRLIAQHFAPSSSFLRPFSTPPAASMAYEKELHIALLAVQRATILTKRVFNSHAKGTLSKSDASPVTIGDFGAQALIISAIQHNFPNDEIVAEEESKDLQENSELRSTVWDLVKDVSLDDTSADEELGGKIKSDSAMLDIIDKGNSKGGAKGRIWALDPIDGTKGFLRGGQYAVCLALMVDGDVKVGVLGCPNLPEDDKAPLTENIGQDASDDEGKGVLFGAVQGEGATSRPMSKGKLGKEQSIKMSQISDLKNATFCESVEAGHSSHGDQAQIAEKLGITKPSVRMDSQAKYASIARGAGDVYLRLPTRKDYQEKIWDHAAGDLIVREAGGKVTDSEGKNLDFSIGRTLAQNKGVVAAPKQVHDEVLKAVMSVLGSK